MVNLGSYSPFKQDWHPNLPEHLKIGVDKPAIVKIWERNQKTGSTITGTLLKYYMKDVIWGIIFVLIAQIIVVGNTLMYYFVVREAKNFMIDGKEQFSPNIFIWLFLGLFSGQILDQVWSKFNCFWMMRVGFRFNNNITSILYDKLLKISVINPSMHSQGKIINYFESDAPSVCKSMQSIVDVGQSLFNLIVGVGAGYIIFGWYFFLYILTACFFGMLGFFVSKWEVRLQAQLVNQSDLVINLLKNCLKSLKFIKMMSWEDYYYKKIEKRRNTQISLNIKMWYCQWMWGFFDMNIYTMSKIVMFSVMFLNGEE